MMTAYIFNSKWTSNISEMQNKTARIRLQYFIGYDDCIQ